MNKYSAHDNRSDRVAHLHDASRPFVVLCIGSKGSKRIVGRYATMQGVNRRVADLRD